jgi:TrkA domain protein
MAEVEETGLPGVGVRHEFKTAGGDRLGVVAHHSGRRDLLLYDRRDPDACREVVPLGDDDTRTLAELLGAAHIVERLSDLPHAVRGLAVDWLPITEDGAFAGKTLQETRLRALTGVSIVAVIRDDEPVPAPPGEFRLEAGDTAVVIGTPAGIRSTVAMLSSP